MSVSRRFKKQIPKGSHELPYFGESSGVDLQAASFENYVCTWPDNRVASWSRLNAYLLATQQCRLDLRVEGNRTPLAERGRTA